jgi:hypothetical protein
MAPRLREFIRVEGRIDKSGPKDTPVRNLRFRDLTFMHGERDRWMEVDSGLQHDWEMHDKANAMLRLRGAENCVIEQCHFVHSGGTAIRVDLHGQENRIIGNHIEHIGGTGVLLRGAGAGNVIRRNYVHHLLSPTRMQSAIRTDGGQMDTLIAENLIYKCVSQGITLKLNNRAENNIIADLIEARYQGKAIPVSYLKLREGPMTGGAIKRNILYHSGVNADFYSEKMEKRFSVMARAKDSDTNHNIYYCAGDPELSQTVLDKKQREGVDAHSLAVDPLFIDPANGDFRLKPESPALKLGFIPIDISKIGLQRQK